jgi:hypothetical protein
MRNGCRERKKAETVKKEGSSRKSADDFVMRS